MKEQTAYYALMALAWKITKGGGIHGNPYLIQEVERALWVIAAQRGIKEWEDALEPITGKEGD